MEIGRVIKGIGKGSLFSYGRFLGVHNPLGSRIGKAKDPYINLGTLSRLSLSNKTEIKNAAVDNISGRLRSPSSKAQIEHIFSSFDSKIIARALSGEVFKHQWLQAPILEFMDKAFTNKDVSSDIFRKALIRLTSYPTDLYHEIAKAEIAKADIAIEAFCWLLGNRTSAELEQIAQIGPSPNVANYMMEEYVPSDLGCKVTRKSLLALALHDYGANKKINSKIYSVLEKNLSSDEMDSLSKSEDKDILKKVCLNSGASPVTAANAISGLIKKIENESDKNELENICLSIKKSDTGIARIIKALSQINYHHAAFIIKLVYSDDDESEPPASLQN